MSNSSRLLTMALPWRKICAAIPAVAFIGGGIASSAAPAPPRDIKAVVVSSHSPAIVVPDSALVIPPIPTGSARISADPHAVAAPKTPALVLPEGTVPGSSTPVTLDSMGIPVRALEAYREAASLVDAADPGCHIDWALLAAIGRVESNHARFGDNQLDSAGIAQPGIIGIPLDGSNGTALITDSDGGRLDRDNSYDRAVGPMQFIPSTWRVVGTDGDGDGAKNPQDMADAATATAIYLCSGPGDLSQPDDLRAAIMRYNPSDSYVRTVTAIADAYRHSVTVLPASDLPASGPPTASPAPSKSVPATPATKTAKIPAGKPAPRRPGSTPTKAPVQRPAVAPVTTTPAPTPTASTSTPTPDPAPTACTSTPTSTPTPTASTSTPTSTPTPTASTSTPTSTPTPDPTPTTCTSTPSPTA
jgi:Transglycosylase SLT domain